MSEVAYKRVVEEMREYLERQNSNTDKWMQQEKPGSVAYAMLEARYEGFQLALMHLHFITEIYVTFGEQGK